MALATKPHDVFLRTLRVVQVVRALDLDLVSQLATAKTLRNKWDLDLDGPWKNQHVVL